MFLGYHEHMILVSRPRSYTALCFLTLLFIPVFLLNSWILKTSGSYSITTPTGWGVFCFQMFLLFVSFGFLLKKGWIGFFLLTSLSSILVLLNIYFLSKTKSYALAFYLLFLIIFSALFLINFFNHLKEPFYHSGCRWYESLPRFLPNIMVELQSMNQKINCSISKITAEGCFVYVQDGLSEKNISTFLKEFKKIHLKFSKFQVSCAVKLISVDTKKQGAGFQFATSSLDQTKDLREFVDRIRSYGYVA